MPELRITAMDRLTVLRVRSWRPGFSSKALPPSVAAALCGSHQVLCIGPGEWLIVCPADSAVTLRDERRGELSERDFAMVDLSDAYACVEVHGSDVRKLLSKSCGLDLDPRAFPPGHSARTRLALISVVIACAMDPSHFELYVPRSYATYLQSWLADAALEFAAAEVSGGGAVDQRGLMDSRNRAP